MFIIANVVTFNGGSTFLIRLSREYARRGHKVGILLLMDRVDRALLSQLELVADVYHLRDYVRYPFKWSVKTQLGSFMPVNFQRLNRIIAMYGDIIHVMGIFGLMFAVRAIATACTEFKLTAGVYHQYEYMFGSDSFLAKYAQGLFKQLAPEAIVFFNESTKNSYKSYFGNDYSNSLIVPIGIELPAVNSIEGDFRSHKIISIGNLNRFKTYNLHMIRLMPELLAIEPTFTYEIYGEGELESEMRSLIYELGLENNVTLKGRIPYSNFQSVLKNAFLFVGSGTAIVEAAALGIPCLIGIESTKEPITYGFLSSIEGFSYNELDTDTKVMPMLEFISEIATDENRWDMVAKECQAKAKTFSVSKTVDGFEQIVVRDYRSIISYRNTILSLFAYIKLGLSNLLGFDKSFVNRRNGQDFNSDSKC